MRATLLKEYKVCETVYVLPKQTKDILQVEVTDPVGNILTISEGMKRKGWKIDGYSRGFYADDLHLQVTWVYSS